MPRIDYMNDGNEHEYEATTYTLLVYEQEFKSDLIKDVFGRIDTRAASQNFDENGNLVAMDYTIDNWNCELKAFWAMLRTSAEIARSEGRFVDAVPGYREWNLSVAKTISKANRDGEEGVAIDMGQISQAVFNECQRGLFRAGAADSEK